MGKWMSECECITNLRVVLFLAGLLVGLHAALLHFNVRRDQSKHGTPTSKFACKKTIQTITYYNLLKANLHKIVIER